MKPAAVRFPALLGFLRSRTLILILVGASLVFLLLSPLEPTIDRVKAVAPWVGAGLVLSEAAFIGGLILMASSAGIGLGRNPLHWRERLPVVLSSLQHTPLFWIGLTANTLGGIGTGVVLFVAIVRSLPFAAWGLLILPVADLALTVAVRLAVVAGVRSQPLPHATVPGGTSTGSTVGRPEPQDTKEQDDQRPPGPTERHPDLRTDPG